METLNVLAIMLAVIGFITADIIVYKVGWRKLFDYLFFGILGGCFGAIISTPIMMVVIALAK